MSETALAQPPATTKTTNPPTFKLKLGNISIALFTNEKSTREGEPFTAKDIVVEKSWQKADGSYDSRKLRLDPKDAMKVITGLQQAYLAAYADKN